MIVMTADECMGLFIITWGEDTEKEATLLTIRKKDSV